jgi:putative transposase
VINEVIRMYQLKYMTSYLCELTGVSRGGYYKWLKTTEKRAISEDNDYEDYLLVKCVYDAHNGKAGYRTLYMDIAELLEIPMNHKKILRIMGKYNFFAKVRRANPYRKLAQATQAHKTVPNILDRQFEQDEPGKVFLTDITYLPHQNGQVGYLSCVKDVATREIVAFDLSTSLHMGIVERTLQKLEEALDGNIHPESMIHSDQGFHYTHPEYQERVKKMGLLQSMSRRGNCLDNAPMESFFGHLKDEIDYKQAII